MKLLTISLGGAAGSLLRFWLSTFVQGRAGTTFPLGTLSVNIIGSLLIGVLFILLQHRFNGSELVRTFLVIGVLGGFTTFSAFSMDTINLINAGFWYRSILNIIVSVAACLVAVVAGMSLGKYLGNL